MLLHTYGAAMDICASAGEVDRALQVAHYMTEAGIPLNKVRLIKSILGTLFIFEVN